MHLIFKTIILTCAIYGLFVEGTLTPKSPKTKKSGSSSASGASTDKVKVGPQNSSVFDEHLIVESPSSKDILNNYQSYYKNVDFYNTEATVLGYVTPVSPHKFPKIVAKITLFSGTIMGMMSQKYSRINSRTLAQFGCKSNSWIL